MLEVERLSAAYGIVRVLWDVTFKVDKGKTVSIIGPNGAGKSTLVKTIMGLLKPNNGRIIFKGEDVTHLPPYQRVKRGMVLIPEGRNVFPKMSVLENLLLGAYTVENYDEVEETKEWIYQVFPVLEKKEKTLAGVLSGGEQQMLVIGRGLMSRPELLILDEPSLGLAPILMEKMLDTICKINDEGVTILLVEQNIQETLEISDEGYILEEGRIVKSGRGRSLLSDRYIKEVYMGM